MRLPRRLALLVAAIPSLLVAAIPSLLVAQTPRADAPEAVVRSFLEALAAKRWRDAAGLVELSQYAEELRATIESARQAPETAVPTVDELRRRDSSLSVAEAQARAVRLRAGRLQMRDWLLAQYAGVPTIDSLARLELREAAARWLEANDEANALRRSWTRNPPQGCALDSTSMERLLRQMVGPPPVVLGSAVRRDLGYVMVGTPDDSAATLAAVASGRRPVVVRVVRWGGRWLIRDWRGWRNGFGGTFGGCVADQRPR